MMAVVVLLVRNCELAFVFALIPKGEIIYAQIVFDVNRPGKMHIRTVDTC